MLVFFLYKKEQKATLRGNRKYNVTHVHLIYETTATMYVQYGVPIIC